MSKAKRSRKIQMKRKQREAKERLLKTSFKKFLEFLGVHTKALTRLNLAFLNLRDEVINARQCLQKYEVRKKLADFLVTLKRFQEPDVDNAFKMV